MSVSWNKDIDTALKQAKTQHKPVLVDFSAAPAYGHALGWKPNRTLTLNSRHS